MHPGILVNIANPPSELPLQVNTDLSLGDDVRLMNRDSHVEGERHLVVWLGRDAFSAYVVTNKYPGTRVLNYGRIHGTYW
eukprot:2175100-Rhodomonas_salina.1